MYQVKVSLNDYWHIYYGDALLISCGHGNYGQLIAHEVFNAISDMPPDTIPQNPITLDGLHEADKLLVLWEGNTDGNVA